MDYRLQMKQPIPKYSDRFKDVLDRFKMNEKVLKQQYISNLFFYRIKSLGVGAHSVVYLVQDDTTKMIYAQKCINKKHAKEIKEDLISQIKIHYRLNHKNIINLYHFYSDESQIYLIMQTGLGSLFSYLTQKKKLKEDQVINIIWQILLGINYLHSQEIIHADIKLENIVLKNGQVKICDFGCAYNYGNCKNKQVFGTLEYLAPQLIHNSSINDKKRDIWALGIICYELLTGHNPMKGLTQNQKWTMLFKFTSFEIDIQISKQMKQFLDCTLCQIQNRKDSKNLLKLSLFQHMVAQ